MYIPEEIYVEKESRIFICRQYATKDLLSLLHIRLNATTCIFIHAKLHMYVCKIIMYGLEACDTIYIHTDGWLLRSRNIYSRF